MTDYVTMERDFIERTLMIIEQYDELVLGHVDPEHEYEDTLMMNCLLALLIYPQQLACRDEWQDWLTTDFFVKVASKWGLKQEYVKCAGYKYCKQVKLKADGTRMTEKVPVKITIDQLTMRNLIRQMRNTAAHASFTMAISGKKQGQIQEIEFRDETLDDGFHMVIPVGRLRKFIRALANSALETLAQHGY